MNVSPVHGSSHHAVVSVTANWDVLDRFNGNVIWCLNNRCPESWLQTNVVLTKQATRVRNRVALLIVRDRVGW